MIKFEVYTSLKDDRNGTEAFLSSQKSVTITPGELVDAICAIYHKKGLDANKCIGFKITNEVVTLLFER